MHIDMPGLSGMDYPRYHASVAVAHIHQDWRARRVEVPHVMRDVLVVPLVLAGVEVDRHHRVGKQIVAGTYCAIKVRRGVPNHEVHRARFPVDRWRHPHAAAERLVEVATLLSKLLLLGIDIAFKVPAGRIPGRPHAFLSGFGNRVEGPKQLTCAGVERFHEAANAVLTPVGANQYLAIDHNRRHLLAVAQLGIADHDIPQKFAGPGVERHQLCVERAHE